MLYLDYTKKVFLKNIKSVYIQKIALRHFRSFSEFTCPIEQQNVFIIGANGAGKTALCEALFYGCFARSFKTHLSRELIQFGSDHATLSLLFSNQSGLSTLHVGMNGQKKIIKLNETHITTAKQLLRIFPVVVLSEHDMELVAGSPSARRTFIDHYLLLVDPEYTSTLRKLHTIVEQRTAILQKNGWQDPSFERWTHMLWQHSQIIQEKRMCALQAIMSIVTALGTCAPFSWSFAARYQTRENLEIQFENFWRAGIPLFITEQRQKKTLFGAHLDDIIFLFNQKVARLFASRGQQKLFVFLLKCSVVELLKNKGEKPVFILDDIMADFDDQRLAFVVSILQNLACQLFITASQQSGPLFDHFLQENTQKIFLEEI